MAGRAAGVMRGLPLELLEESRRVFLGRPGSESSLGGTSRFRLSSRLCLLAYGPPQRAMRELRAGNYDLEVRELPAMLLGEKPHRRGDTVFITARRDAEGFHVRSPSGEQHHLTWEQAIQAAASVLPP
jgi:hypothetical protein